MIDLSKKIGPVFNDDNLINLYYLNEVYGNIAEHVSHQMQEEFQTEVPISSGVWGGTYLIANETGLSRRIIWRLYSIVNLPQIPLLENKSNLDTLIDFYYQAYAEAFKPWGLKLDLNMWGGTLPYSCKEKPSFTMHMVDSTKKVHWLRAFFIWNYAPWEESIIYDTVRIIKEYKEYFDIEKGPRDRDPKELKFILQDIIIIYRTLENACSADFKEHAEPIIQELVEHFLIGLHDPKLIVQLYRKVFENALIYGYEQALEGPYANAGLDIRKVEEWPKEKINWVPDELKKNLVPPIQKIFRTFKENLG